MTVRRRWSPTGLALAVPTALFVLGPLGFLVWMGLAQERADFLERAQDLDLPMVVGQVALLATLTTVWAGALGVPLAWLTVRTDLPARRLLHWLAPLPLAIPPYIGALVYQILLAPGGVLPNFLGVTSLPLNLYGVGGAAWILGLFTYPYLYLLVSGALERTNPALEEAARGAGLSPRRVLTRVTLPLLRPSLLAGGLVVFLYSWADFGVVSLLRVRTLTTIIYDYIQGTADWALPSALSILLTAITILVLLLQLRVLGRAGYTQIVGAVKPAPLVSLGAWRWPAFAYVGGMVTLTLLLPLGVLGYQASRLSASDMGAFALTQWPYLVNSLWTAVAGASLALLIALGVARSEGRGRAWRVSGLLQVGYAIPGTVLGLGLAGFLHATLPWIYATPLALIVAYVVLYITPAFQAVKAALAQLHPSIEEAARSLGRGPLAAFHAVTLPLIKPGLVAGWLLVFVLSMRELAATLIVRPPGFDTLPVRIWTHAMDVGPEPRAAALALALVLTIALPWFALLSRRLRGISPSM
ncbi:MAG: iron ABC transporter permease [Candidatus Rokubacteria bacterium]|nr:iron ABC transporter permease [Candidatus Rokubacteria bacterium]